MQYVRVGSLFMGKAIFLESTGNPKRDAQRAAAFDHHMEQSNKDRFELATINSEKDLDALVKGHPLMSCPKCGCFRGLNHEETCKG